MMRKTRRKILTSKTRRKKDKMMMRSMMNIKEMKNPMTMFDRKRLPMTDECTLTVLEM